MKLCTSSVSYIFKKRRPHSMYLGCKSWVGNWIQMVHHTNSQCIGLIPKNDLKLIELQNLCLFSETWAKNKKTFAIILKHFKGKNRSKRTRKLLKKVNQANENCESTKCGACGWMRRLTLKSKWLCLLVHDKKVQLHVLKYITFGFERKAKLDESNKIAVFKRQKYRDPTGCYILVSGK